MVSRHLRRLGAVLLMLIPFAAACTPAQIEWFEHAPPDVQQSVVHYLQVQNAHPGGFLACVRHHESGGDYQAQNGRSTASGAYQFLDSTWRTVSSMAGYPGYAKARYAPASVQDAVASYVVNNPGRTGGRSNWNGTGC